MHRIRVKIEGEIIIQEYEFDTIEIIFTVDLIVFIRKDIRLSLPFNRAQSIKEIVDMNTGEIWHNFDECFRHFQNLESSEKPHPSERARKVRKVKRKKINKVKADTVKRDRVERLRKAKKENEGFGLKYVFKSGRFAGMSVRIVINSDLRYIENIISGKMGFKFKLNKEAFNYFASARKEYYDNLDRLDREREARRKRDKKEQEEAERNRRNSTFNTGTGGWPYEGYSDGSYWKDLFRGHDSGSDRESFDFFGRSAGRQQKQQRSNYNSGRSSRFFTTIGSQERIHGTVLGFIGKVQKSEIKKLWRRSALKWHPDKWENGTTKEKETAHNKMVEVNGAYDYFKKRYSL
ncbi:hypothetical protein DRH27_00055 [Candidatus Falkowbacteria bacterium]|nr:MAG: hypothetical protein DRH27_00055 [Candidatus Falkowbacteria bacterium]